MDLEKGLCNNSYYKIVSIIHTAVSIIFDLCTKKAAKEEQNLNEKKRNKKDEQSQAMVRGQKENLALF